MKTDERNRHVMEIDVPVELLVKGLLVFQLPWANGKLNGGSQKRHGKKLHIVFSYIFSPKMSYLNSSGLKDKRKHKKQLNLFPPQNFRKCEMTR